MAHADMPERVEHAFVGGDAVGKREFGKRIGDFLIGHRRFLMGGDGWVSYIIGHPIAETAPCRLTDGGHWGRFMPPWPTRTDRHRRRQPPLSPAARTRGAGARPGLARGANREFVALLGPSGCGKSTLLYLIGGFLPVETGTITVDGKPVAGPGPDRGIVFQHFALFPWKTVRGNILYGLERQGMPKEEREKRAHGLHRAGRPLRLRGQLPLAALRRHAAAQPRSRARSPSIRRSC